VKRPIVNFYNTFIKLYFSFGLAFLPLVYWTAHPVVYEVPKVIVFQWWMRGLVVLGVLGAYQLRFARINVRIVGLMVGFFLMATVFSMMGLDFEKSVVGNYYRRDGLLTLLHLMSLSMVVMLYWKPYWRAWSIGGVAVGVGMISLWTVWKGFLYYIWGDAGASEWNGPIGVSFGQPNFLAGYLLVTLPWITYIVMRVKSKKLRLAGSMGIGIVQIAIGLTQSWIALGLSLFFWVAYSWQQGFRARKILALVGFVGVLLLINLFMSRHVSDGFVAEGRGRIWRQTLSGALKRPLTGYGLTNVDYAFEAGDWPIQFEEDIYLDKAHMMLLEIAATTGVFGFVTYLGLLTCTGYGIWRQYGRGTDRTWWWATGAVLGLFVLHSQTNVLSISEEMLFWLVVGIVGSTPIKARSE
jgi:O-antigen ligase